jgi:transcriptional regulator with XRE-family HTH domain
MGSLTRLTILLSEALAVASLSLSDLAVDLGISSSALRRYRLGNRIPDAALARRISRALHSRARRLESLADRLDSMINSQLGGSDE